MMRNELAACVPVCALAVVAGLPVMDGSWNASASTTTDG